MKTKLLATAVTVALIASHSALSAEAERKGGFSAGPLRVYPSVTLSFKYDNNVTHANRDETASFATEVSPNIDIDLAFSKKVKGRYSVSAGVDANSYADSSDDDYLDVFAEGKADWDLSQKSDLGVKLGYDYKHEARGTTDRLSSEPNTYNKYDLSGVFGYGRKEATARIELSPHYEAVRYSDFTLPEKIDDTDKYGLRGTLFYQVMPKTSALFELRNEMTEYINETDSSRDSTAWWYMTGLTWKATSKTTGIAKIGYHTKDYDGLQNDPSGLSWDIGLQWDPRQKDSVNFITQQVFADPTGMGEYLDTKAFRAKWTHRWMPRLSSNAGFTLARTDYEGVDRSDDWYSINLNTNYSLNRWLSLGAGLSVTERDANIDEFDYTQHIFMISITGSL